MDTHRRHFLRLCGVAGIGTLVGCTGSPTNDGSQTPTGTTTGGTQRTEPTTEDGTSTRAKTSPGGTKPPKLTDDDAEGGDSFGWSVAVSSDGTTAIIGAVGDEDPNAEEVGTTDDSTDGETGTPEDRYGHNMGSAYVFEASDGSWSQQAKLTAEDGDGGDRFGRSVAVSSDGSTAIVGADGAEDSNGERVGSAYVFGASGGTWNQQVKLTPDDGDEGDQFGTSVALANDGSKAIVGAVRDEDPNGEKAGSAYAFHSSDGSWSQQAKLTPDDGDSKDDFGRSVAVSGDGTTALIGAALDEDPNGHLAGSVYVFQATDGSWNQQAKFTPDDGDSDDTFGWSVAVTDDGTTALVGALGDEDPNGDLAGSAYVFGATDGSWTKQAKLTANDGDGGDWFGRSVAVSSDGSTALVGAENKLHMEGNAGQGAAYVFGASGGSWSQQDKLTAIRGGSFGNAVSVSSVGTTALVGDAQDIVQDVGPAGSAYVFTL